MTLRDDSRELYDRLQILVSDYISLCMRVLAAAERPDFNESEMCDVGYLLRESEKLSDELRKETKAKKDLVGKVLALRVIMQHEHDPTTDLKAEGELATGVPDVKMRPKLPKHGTEQYDALMRFFGVPDEFARTGALSIHFVHMSELLTRLAEEGRQTPPGITDTFPEHTMTFRKKKRRQK